MKRPKPRPAEKKPLPIDWNRSTAFKIPISRDEKQQLAALRRYDILDTQPEKNGDRIKVLALHVRQTPLVLLVWNDQGRQRLKAKVGLRLKETPRE